MQTQIYKKYVGRCKMKAIFQAETFSLHHLFAHICSNIHYCLRVMYKHLIMALILHKVISAYCF